MNVSNLNELIITKLIAKPSYNSQDILNQSTTQPPDKVMRAGC